MRDGSETCTRCGSEYDSEMEWSVSDSGTRPSHRATHHPAGEEQPSDSGDVESSPNSGDGIGGTKDTEEVPGKFTESASGDDRQRIGRRKLLLGGAGGVALLGSLAVLRDTSAEGASVVREFYDALDRADVDTARGLVHEDAPQGAGIVNVSRAYLRERRFTIQSLTQYDSSPAPDRESVRQFLHFSVVVTVRTVSDGTSADASNHVAEQLTVAENGIGEYRIWDV